MDTVADFISHNPDILRYRKQINDGINAARAAFFDRLAEGITRELQPEFQVRLRANLVQGRFGTDPNGSLIITAPAGSALNKAPFEIWVEHIDKWEALVVGIEAKYGKPPLSAAFSALLKEMNRRLDEYSQTQGYHKSDPLPSWSGTYWPTGWHDILQGLDDQYLADLLERPFGKVLAEVCSAIRIHIALLERIYLEASSAIDDAAP